MIILITIAYILLAIAGCVTGRYVYKLQHKDEE